LEKASARWVGHLGRRAQVVGKVVGNRTVDQLTIEREKGFEPSTSTLATCFRARDSRVFARLKVHEGAAQCTSVVGIGGERFRGVRWVVRCPLYR
jgi:hypothetical protein